MLCLSVTEAEAARQQGEITKLMSTRKAAELLSSKAGTSMVLLLGNRGDNG